MDRKTTELQVVAAVSATLPAAAVVGMSLWIFRRIESVIAAHQAFEASLDRRLRSVEEAAARTEAEVRFTAERLGNPAYARPTLTQIPVSDEADVSPAGAEVAS